MAASGLSRRDSLNVERLTIEHCGAKLPEPRIGAVEWHFQIDERESALGARDSIYDKLDTTDVHPDERKSCAKLQFGRSPPHASHEDAFKDRL